MGNASLITGWPDYATRTYASALVQCGPHSVASVDLL